MGELPVVLLHGYSDNSRGLQAWERRLFGDRDVHMVHVAEYATLTNEITVRDLAEGLDRALREQAGLREGQPFDAIVHSTGMLVIREWMAAYPGRRARVKHLVGLAPATFGSPLAHKGRSWMGALFKGNRDRGPDFLEAGDLVLRGLELGSPYTWRLAEQDLLPDEVCYGDGTDTPYPFIFVGLAGYDGLRSLADEEGTDGTVRWAGAGFNARRVVVDFTLDAARGTTPVAGDAREELDRSRGGRLQVTEWRNTDVPLVFLPGLNHASILRDPSDELVEMVRTALEVDGRDSYAQWRQRHGEWNAAARARTGIHSWQQFVVRAVDERGDPVPDYYIELCEMRDGRYQPLDGFQLDVHACAQDPSYRCFHADLDELAVDRRQRVGIRLVALSGTRLVSYYGLGSQTFTTTGEPLEGGVWDAMLDLTDHLRDPGFDFFTPFTTTLVELRLNREPWPPSGRTKLFYFVPPGSADGGEVS